MNKSNMTALKATGIIMIVFALVYALLGTLAVSGIINNALPGHKKQETMIVVLGYVVALLALICGVVCIKGAVAPAKLFGAVFAVLGLAALLYQQLAHDAFSIFDCLAMCFGVSIYSIASQIEKEN